MPDAAPGTEHPEPGRGVPAGSDGANGKRPSQKDLKGADYEKKLVWRTEEGIAVRPYYRPRRPRRRWQRQIRESRPGTAAGKRSQDAAPAGGRDPRGPAPRSRRAPPCRNWVRAGRGVADRLAAGADAAAAVSSSSRSAPNYFFEIAKLRAARLLWAQVVAAFGSKDGDAAHASHVRTPRAQQERLRPLHEPAARDDRSAVGGARRLRPLDGRAVRLRRRTWRVNVQRILRRRRTSTRWPIRPAAPTTSKRSPTRWPARPGSCSSRSKPKAATPSGGRRVHRQGAGSSRAARKDKAMSSRRRALVGVNNYPEPDGEDARTERAATSGRRAGAWPSRSKRSGCAPSGMRAPPAGTRRCCCSSAAT